MKIFYYTSTGNSLQVAKAFDAELLSIPQILAGENKAFSDDAIGIVFPCYYFGVPRIVKEFIKTIKFDADYIFGIITCGNKTAGTANQFTKLSAEAGKTINYVSKIVMVDNYLPIFESSKQIEKLPAKKVEENLARIKSEVESRKTTVDNSGALANTATFLGQLLYKTVNSGNKDKKYKIEDSCDGCRVCAKACPVNNIKVDQKPEFLHHCDECMGCVHLCPKNAIHLKRERSRARFINPTVSLQEIIKSNDF